jgi:putative transposase
MESVRKPYQKKLRPMPAQERALERVLWRCRTLYNTALEQRIWLWKQRGASLTRHQQEAELTALRAQMPEYAAIHSHVLQDVLARLDTTYQAFFRRVAHGDKPAFRAFRAGAATTPSPTKSTATVPASITALWSSPRSGASPSGGPAR